jgi:hypothetical protein
MDEKTRRNEWMKKAGGLFPAAKGSLREVLRNCSRPSCGTCSPGKKHRAWLFTYYLDGKQRSKHVPKSAVKELKKALANGRRMEKAMVLSALGLIDGSRER